MTKKIVFCGGVDERFAFEDLPQPPLFAFLHKAYLAECICPSRQLENKVQKPSKYFKSVQHSVLPKNRGTTNQRKNLRSKQNAK